MVTWPDAPALRAFLARVSRRLTWIAAAEGAAAGFAIAMAVALAIAATTSPGRASINTAIIAGVSLAAVGIIVRTVLSRVRPPRIAQLVERRAPECRNIVVTAAELIDQPARVRAHIGALICAQAARVVSQLDAAALFPARRAVAALGTSAVLFSLAVVLVAARPTVLPGSSKASAEAAVITGIDVVITPPAYTARPIETLRDPARIEALAGSRIRVTVRAEAAAVTLETIGGKQTLSVEQSQTFTGELSADADGFIAIEPAAADGSTGLRRLIGVSVNADQAPRVRVTAPGRDLFLSDARRTLPLAIEASDDLGLASLRLRYTRVSGSGEQFTFAEGELPLDIARRDGRTWKAGGALRLEALGLTPGDMLVYRGVALDHRPGALPTESDSYIVEITAPGAIATDGFAIDDENDRYGISQQMVILKTERLIARAPTMAAESLSLAARTLAAEQRAVRAEFVFMMGGELAEEVLAEASMADLNEEAHAEADDEAIAGRLVNRGRIDLLQAIRSMSRANTALNAAELTRALENERAALAALQRAFSRTRYILRTLTQRERLDLSRRLTGTLTEVGRAVRPVGEATADVRVSGLRRALAGIAELAGAAEFAADAATRASMLAENVLRVDPSAESLQRVSAQLTSAATAISQQRGEEARRLLDGAATALAAEVRAGLLDAPRRAPALDVGRLDGALTDALRRAGAR